MPKRIFISADHGLAIVYFLQSAVVRDLIDAGCEVVLLTDSALKAKIEERFGQPGLIVESLRLDEARKYLRDYQPSRQYWLDFFRRAGASNRINLGAVESFIDQVQTEAGKRRRQIFPLIRLGVFFLQRSRMLRQWLVRRQRGYNPGLYADLFEKYQPELVIASTPGWRLDRYLMREAARRGVTTATVIVGWDNPSSYSLPGADMDWATCWSEIQKQELVDGSDWAPAQVLIGGIPSYDGYIEGRWRIDRDA